MNPIDARVIDALRRQESAVEVTGLELGWVTGYYDLTTGTIATDTTDGLDQGYMWVHKDDVTANNVIALIGDRMWKDHQQAGRRCWVGYIHGNQRVAYAPLVDQISAAANTAGYLAYTPTWTGSSSNPAIGNGGFYSRYALYGTELHFTIIIVAGSTTTFGSGYWAFTLPYDRSSAGAVSVAGYAYDSSTGNYYVAGGRVNTSDVWVINNASGLYGSGVPFTWAQNDILSFGGFYQIG